MPEAQVVLLENPLRLEAMQRVEELAGKAGAGMRLIVYFVGRGFLDGAKAMLPGMVTP